MPIFFTFEHSGEHCDSFSVCDAVHEGVDDARIVNNEVGYALASQNLTWLEEVRLLPALLRDGFKFCLLIVRHCVHNDSQGILEHEESLLVAQFFFNFGAKLSFNNYA